MTTAVISESAVAGLIEAFTHELASMTTEVGGLKAMLQRVLDDSVDLKFGEIEGVMPYPVTHIRSNTVRTITHYVVEIETRLPRHKSTKLDNATRERWGGDADLLVALRAPPGLSWDDPKSIHAVIATPHLLVALRRGVPAALAACGAREEDHVTVASVKATPLSAPLANKMAVVLGPRVERSLGEVDSDGLFGALRDAAMFRDGGAVLEIELPRWMLSAAATGASERVVALLDAMVALDIGPDTMGWANHDDEDDDHLAGDEDADTLGLERLLWTALSAGHDQTFVDVLTWIASWYVKTSGGDALSTSWWNDRALRPAVVTGRPAAVEHVLRAMPHVVHTPREESAVIWTTLADLAKEAVLGGHDDVLETLMRFDTHRTMFKMSPMSLMYVVRVVARRDSVLADEIRKAYGGGKSKNAKAAAKARTPAAKARTPAPKAAPPPPWR
jgi:hypothetical protein